MRKITNLLYIIVLWKIVDMDFAQRIVMEQKMGCTEREAEQSNEFGYS